MIVNLSTAFGCIAKQLGEEMALRCRLSHCPRHNNDPEKRSAIKSPRAPCRNQKNANVKMAI
ncbi:MAG: hypothetical protein KGZ39_02900, partial [Simkania sp.]|nr:hypothetical protein [Simkania sp.]